MIYNSYAIDVMDK